MKKHFLNIVILLPLLFGTAKLGAQVSIGADKAPQSFSVLELVAQYKAGKVGGLRLPQLSIDERNSITGLSDPEAFGLMIYNTDNNCVEFWNSVKWISYCEGETFVQDDPANVTICEGNSATFSLAEATSSSGTISYEWEQSSDDISWSPAPGTRTNADYTTLPLSGDMYFHRIATTYFGSITSASALVTVTPFSQPNPSAANICEGNTHTFTVMAASGGGGTITYQWEESADNTTWGNATGTSTGADYTTSALLSNTYYRRKASADCGTITSAEVLVTVIASPTLTDPTPSIIYVGETAGVTPTSGGTWVSGNTSIATITNAGEITAVGIGTATFTFTDSTTNCSATTSAITVSLPPYLDITPQAALFQSGDNDNTVQKPVTIETNCTAGWMVTAISDDSWLDGIPTINDPQTSPFTFNVYPNNPNSSTADRVATITIEACGITKIVTIQQQGTTCDPGTPPVTNHSYVGAYWRWNQTGERIIRISNIIDAGSLGDWSASVVWMDDEWSAGDIVLDTDSLSTTALASRGIDFNTVIANNLISDAEPYKVTGTAQSVSGTVANSGDSIIFRIGLKSTFDAYDEFTNPARYAVVLLSYNLNDTPKYHKIHLRQGEGADNVTTVSYLVNVKWSPYNVGDYEHPNQYGYDKIVDFPTKAGFYYQWAYGNKAVSDEVPRPYHPQDNVPLSPPWTVYSGADAKFSLNNVCPNGYKVPSSFSGSSGASTDCASLNGGNVCLSGVGFYPTVGYYADGFFDRRMIETANGSNAVSLNNDDVAYAGVLFFNSITKASLFLPAVGYRYPYGGYLMNCGTWGLYWGSGVPSNHNEDGPCLLFGMTSSASMYYGMPIRCVAE